MKTRMKNCFSSMLLGVTLIAMVLALSCAPELELTSRDWGEVWADRDASILSNGPGVGAPTVTHTLRYESTAAYVKLADREMTVTFPQGADVLLANNTAIEAKLKEFLTIWTFTKATVTSDYSADAADKLKLQYDYTFVRRESPTVIVLRLKENTPNERMVMKIDASKYTFSGGKKLGAADDTEVGTERYSVYRDLDVSNVTASTFAFANKYFTINLTIRSNLQFNPKTGITAPYLDVAASNDMTGFIAGNAVSDAEMPGLAGKFTLEKFAVGSSRWEKANATFAYVPTTETTNSNAGRITVEYTPEEFVTYRIKAEGLKNLETTGTYYGIKQRFNVGVGGSYYWSRNTFYSYESTFIDFSKNRTPAGHPVDKVTMEYDSSNSGILRMVYYPLKITGNTADFYPAEMSLADFKKNVRIFYFADGNANNYNLKNIVILDIKDVKYGENEQTNEGKAVRVKDEILVTLNGDKVADIPLSRIYIAYSTGFKYGNDSILSGDYSNWDGELDGLRYFSVDNIQGEPKLNAPDNFYSYYETENSIYLSWDTVTGADYYNVYMSLNQTGPFTVSNDTVSTYYTFTGLTAGTTYYFQVAAVNSKEGYRSATISATTDTPYIPIIPNAPASATAVAGWNNVYVNWSSVTVPGGATVTYKVFRSDDSYTTARITGLTTTNWIDSTVTAETTYTYRVFAATSDGDSASGTTTASVTPGVPPTTFTTLTLDTWENGTLSATVPLLRFNLAVDGTKTYSIWWDDVGDGTTTTADVYVSAYEANGTPIFEDEDNGYTTAKDFDSSVISAQTIYILVYPYSSTSFGTFRIVANDTGTQP
jgi:hypothetical protein